MSVAYVRFYFSTNFSSSVVRHYFSFSKKKDSEKTVLYVRTGEKSAIK